MATRGQYVRLFLGSDNTATPTKVIAAAKSLTLHVSCSFEDDSTKDSNSLWVTQEMVGINYDIQTDALIRGNNIPSGGQAVADVLEIYEAGDPVKWFIATVNGANNRTKQKTILSGSCLVQQLTLNAQNRQIATYNTQLVGVGDYTVGND